MARIATQSDFENGGLYNPPYRRYPFFAIRAAEIKRRFTSGEILIAGCGYGYLVDEALAIGVNVYGLDAASYALGKAPAGIASRLFQANVLTAAQVNAVRAAVMPGNKKFTAVVTEDLLPCLDDTEYPTAVANLRAISSGNLLHIVTPAGGGANPDPGLNWKTKAAWQALLTPDVVIAVQEVE